MRRDATGSAPEAHPIGKGRHGGGGTDAAQERLLVLQRHDGASLYATTDLAALRHRTQEARADRVLYVTDTGQARGCS